MGTLHGSDGQEMSQHEISVVCCDTVVKLSEWGMFTDELM